jgi:hypothetical protein
MAWNRKQASAVRGRRITDWVNVRIKCSSSASLMHCESNCEIWGSNSGADEGSWTLRYYTVPPGEIVTDVSKKHSASIIKIQKAWILNKINWIGHSWLEKRAQQEWCPNPRRQVARVTKFFTMEYSVWNSLHETLQTQDFKLVSGSGKYV